MDGAELVARLYDRYASALSESQRADMDCLIHEEALVALIDLLYLGLDRGDLQSPEVSAGLELARAGKFLKSSDDLAARLAEYQRTHVAV
ncbi:hypothetical protein [Mycobacterium talmoniae]|uniref:hypothetical protein n=1 Tax=Mycobacterium talmoniae TaxID=1858794 RepID=UPI001058F6D3|nr:MULTISPECIES: hypothetical protein [Mycobacterium]TDH55039.1 hypothetical protein E2F47_10725 [Mycobacterium eburneum]